MDIRANLRIAFASIAVLFAAGCSSAGGTDVLGTLTVINRKTAGVTIASGQMSARTDRRR